MPIPQPVTDPLHPSFLMELRRKGIHVLALIIPIGLCFFPTKPALFLLFFVTTASLCIELLRFRFSTMQALFMKIFSPLLREHEEKMLTGSTALCLSASLCTAGFLIALKTWVLEEPARLSLYYAFTFIILGDAAAALFGKLYGRRKILGSKTWVGSFACLLSCLIIYFVSMNVTGGWFPWETAALGALLTTVLEILPFRLDDNLRVAPITCFTMYFLLKAGLFA
jgi:dolichol kinase